MKCFSDPAEVERQERKRKAEELKQEFIKKQQKKKTEDEVKVSGLILSKYNKLSQFVNPPIV